jgi:hypothetical protein
MVHESLKYGLKLELEGSGKKGQGKVSPVINRNISTAGGKWRELNNA